MQIKSLEKFKQKFKLKPNDEGLLKTEMTKVYRRQKKDPLDYNP